jgi:16S rRNA (adenine1518-N6/adenine1519-N6)-dimethyltransferase
LTLPNNKSTGALLRELNLRPRKGLGQNFLVDQSVPPKILAAAQISATDRVVEIGPGVGVLTLKLAPAVQELITIELDERLYPYLKEQLAPYPHAHLIEGDALKFEPASLAPTPYKLVANIPYYITSAIIRHFLESEHRPTRLVLLVQKEVAQRIVAQPPEMSLLAVSVQFYGKPKLYAHVPAGAFLPPPNVDSAILLIETFSTDERACPDVPNGQDTHFFDMVRAGFGQKRKQLVNTLATGLNLSKETTRTLLQTAQIAPENRAEQLSLADWNRLFKALSHNQAL